MGVSFSYPNGVQTLNGHDIEPVGGGPIINSVPTQALTLVSPPPAPPAPPAPPPAMTLDQANALAAQRGYYEPGSIVSYQGSKYEVMGVSIGYTNNVPHVNGHALEAVGGGPILNGIPYSALTLIEPAPPPPPDPTNPFLPPGQVRPPVAPPPPPPPPPHADKAESGHWFGINQNSIVSTQGQFWLEAPGIFVLQDAAGNHKWESPYRPVPANGGCDGQMQTDGNLVAYAYYIYDHAGHTAKNPVWASGTQGNPGAYLQIDWQNYKVKVMSPDGTRTLWSS
ncbi:hypothetical protein ACFXHA_18805 [Nocardia sp. NPDC059240]|uniref:hypothetical protein n=1 Tax=Nocardia sp. NPDC059240 TaxID=3346786 RepID=UPI0036AC0040